uniref:Uncharacterized protein n=1 Tax=Glossina austeni TaxID=7395 RepID=A0A1A9VCM5_GLOAU
MLSQLENAVTETDADADVDADGNGDDGEQLWHRCALGLRGLRSQQRVSKYNNKPNRDNINKPAGIEAKIPRLYPLELFTNDYSTTTSYPDLFKYKIHYQRLA